MIPKENDRVRLWWKAGSGWRNCSTSDSGGSESNLLTELVYLTSSSPVTDARLIEDVPFQLKHGVEISRSNVEGASRVPCLRVWRY